MCGEQSRPYRRPRCRRQPPGRHAAGGSELQSQTKGSHIASGLGAGVSYGLSPSGSTALITLSTATLTHYLAVRKNENIV